MRFVPGMVRISNLGTVVLVNMPPIFTASLHSVNVGLEEMHVGTDECNEPMRACKRTKALSFAGTTLGINGLGWNGEKNSRAVV